MKWMLAVLSLNETAFTLFDWTHVRARAGYRVRYFLGTDRIASMTSRLVRYQLSIPKGFISSMSVSQ